MKPRKQISPSAERRKASSYQCTAGILLVFLLNFPLVSARAQATTFVVTTTADSGPGSLRQALLDANLTAAQDTVLFRIPGAGPHVIAPAAPLPDVVYPIVIDGLSQPGASAAVWPPTLKIVLDGSKAGANADGLRLGDGIFRVEEIRGDSLIRGLVIQNFSRYGIQLQKRATGFTIPDCFIGTDSTGTQARPNLKGGLYDASGWGFRAGPSGRNVIGQPAGVTPGRNLISGNGGEGLIIAGAKGTRVRNNFIGTAADGITPLANARSGILVTGDSPLIGEPAQDLLVGGLAPTEANVISGNLGDGVQVQSGRKIDVLGNRLIGNGRLGINLGLAPTGSKTGVTDNDPADAGDEPDSGTNFPELLGATAVPGGTVITGVLDGTPTETFRVEFFSNRSVDPSGFGEGEVFLGAVMVATDRGPAWFSAQLPAVPAGQYISATATATVGGTSEFSAAIPVVPATVTTLADRGPGSLRAAIEAANATPTPDVIVISPALSGGVLRIGPVPLPTVTGATTILGPGPGRLTISGSGANRIFQCSVPSGSLLKLVDLTLADGVAKDGGAILQTSGNLELNRVTIRNCAATAGNGGAVRANGGDTDLVDCRLSGNTATGNGGAVSRERGVLVVERCTLDNNTAGGTGGGISTPTGGSFALYMRNTTLSDNEAVTGGGLFVGKTISYECEHNTIVHNRATGSGGGIAGPVVSNYSIVSLNTAPVDPNIKDAATLGGSNFYGGDPRIGPLRDNGGWTPTHALLSGSPARDRVTGSAPRVDQRLAPRISGRGNNSSKADFGAYEFFGGPYLNPAQVFTYATWVAAGAPVGQRGPSDDPNGDGVPNLAAYFFGLPAMGETSGEPGTVALDGAGQLRLSFAGSHLAAGVTVGSRVSADLQAWSPGPAPVEVGSTTAGVDYEVTLPIIGSHRFLRLEFTQP